jgi:lipopolysaccharide/colanic/teichoic acid biosynthesis glycosyltransferase
LDIGLPERRDPVIYLFLKRLVDITVVSMALLFAIPFMLVAAILIYLEEPGPVVYRQQRVGKAGKRFTFYKLRSMHLNADQVLERLRHQSDADGIAFKMKRDPRVTAVGRILRKFSIDELPQLFSVLAGHMSLIGPRPHLPSEVACYRPDQRLRLTVKPGLLCYREIRGRSDLTFEEWVRLDLQYIRERGVWTDIKIFLLAFPAVLGAKGAY